MTEHYRIEVKDDDTGEITLYELEETEDKLLAVNKPEHIKGKWSVRIVGVDSHWRQSPRNCVAWSKQI